MAPKSSPRKSRPEGSLSSVDEEVPVGRHHDPEELCAEARISSPDPSTKVGNSTGCPETGAVAAGFECCCDRIRAYPSFRALTRRFPGQVSNSGLGPATNAAHSHWLGSCTRWSIAALPDALCHDRLRGYTVCRRQSGRFVIM
jgi:hypothetical protein